MIWFAQNLWLIPVLPLAASGIIAVNKQSQRKLAATLAIGCTARNSQSGRFAGRHWRKRRAPTI